MSCIKYVGFIRLELVIVIAIIGMLTQVAIPAYQDSVYRAEVTEMIQAAANAKKAVEETIIVSGKIPDSNLQAGYSSPPPSELLTSVEIQKAKGNSLITLNCLANGISFQVFYNGQFNDNQIEWTCRVNKQSFNRFVPPSCRI